MNAALSRRGMLRQHASMVSLVARGLDAIAVVVTGWLASVLLFGALGPTPLRYQTYQFALLLAALLTLVVFPACGVYQSWRGQRMRAQIRALAISWTVVAVLLATLGTLTKTSALFSRQWMTLWFILGAVGLLVFRASLLVVLRRLRKSGWNRRHIVIVGGGELARLTARRVTGAPWTGFDVAAFFADAAPACSSTAAASETPTLPLAQLAAYVEAQPVDEVWLALSNGSIHLIENILHVLRHSTAAIRYVPDIQQLHLINPAVLDIAGMPIIDINVTPMHGVNRVVKAIEDRLFAMLALLFFSPFMLLIAVGVKLSSPGPVFYRQVRLGWNGKPFEMLKFRSMPVNAEDKTGATWARKGEQRATRFGSWLRRTSLDELPQFINVLKGDMSIVGPRPERPVFVEKFKDQVPGYMKKHLVKAGLTGWAQINGWRGDTDLAMRIKYDLHYIEHWSLWFDLKIIALTPFKGLLHKNAY